MVTNNYLPYIMADAADKGVWLAVSINTSNSYGDLEVRSRRFHFDLVYLEILERRIKCNLINPFRERLLRNSTSNPYGDFELRSRRFRFDLVYFENLERRIKCLLYWDRNEIAYTSTPDFRSRRDKNETVYFEVAVRVWGIDRNGQPYRWVISNCRILVISPFLVDPIIFILSIQLLKYTVNNRPHLWVVTPT